MLSEEDRLAKEAALSGLSGGSFSEIVLLLLVIPSCVMLYRSLYQGFLNKSSQLVAGSVSVILLIAPMLVSMSVYSEYAPHICVGSLLISLVVSLISKSENKGESLDQMVLAMNSKMKPFLSNYRSTMMLATCFAILAVDFNKYFPVRFAKCEEYGISLMDIGVGGFIFSSALTAARPQQVASTSSSSSSDSTMSGPAANTRSHKRDESSPMPSWPSRMLHSLKLVVPLLVLGLGRFSVIKAFGYQEHVAEYGMHWNFFMTLAGITLLTTALSVPLKYSGVMGVMIICVYHYVLEGMGVADYIISAPRTDFFSQNREGILSCFGYFAVYLFGQQVGAYLMKSRTRGGWIKATAMLVLVGLVSGGLATFLRLSYDMHPSRRMVNLPYALYTLAANCVVLAAFISVDLVAKTDAPNALLDSVASKRNSQLVIFTLANLMTGAVNVFVGTFNRPPEMAIVVMSLYMLAVSLVSLFWHPVFVHLSSLCTKTRTAREKRLA